MTMGTQRDHPSLINTLCVLFSSPSNFENIYIETPRRVTAHLLLTSGFACILIVGVSYHLKSLDMVIPPNNVTSSYLMSIATVQASALAIGVSVLLLGVELITNRFSTQLTSIVLKNPVFLVTFTLLSGSIGLDLWLIFNINGLYSPVNPIGLGWLIQFIQSVLLYLTGPIAFISGIALFFTIRHGIRRSTPEGILRSLQTQLTPDQFVREAIEAREKENTLHPLSDVYFITRDSLLDEEPRVAHRGLNVYESMITSSKRYIISRQDILEKPDSASEDIFFGPPFTEHLPNLIITGVQTGEVNFVDNTISLFKNLSGVGSDDPVKELMVSGMAGYIQTINRLRWSSDNLEILLEITDALNDHLNLAIDKQWYDEVVRMGDQSYRRMRSLTSGESTKTKTIFLSHFARVIAECLYNLISQFDEVQQLTFDKRDDCHLVEQAIQSLITLFLLSVALLLEYSNNYGNDHPLPSIWNKVLQLHRDKVPRAYLKILNYSFIESLLLHRAKSEEFDEDPWIKLAVQVMERQGPELMLSVFEDIYIHNHSYPKSKSDPKHLWDSLITNSYHQGVLPTQIDPDQTVMQKPYIDDLKSDIRTRY